MKLEKIIKLIEPKTSLQVGTSEKIWECEFGEEECEFCTVKLGEGDRDKDGNCWHLEEVEEFFHEYEGTAHNVPIQLADCKIVKIGVYEYETHPYRGHKKEKKYGIRIVIKEEE